jgi:hypothetical protein
MLCRIVLSTCITSREIQAQAVPQVGRSYLRRNSQETHQISLTLL